MINTITQKYTSANTSINSRKVPKGFKSIKWKPGTRNLDYGGGKYDTATEYLATLGVENLIYDPYNRSEEFNMSTIEKAQDGVDSVTVMNVLNVIYEIEIQKEIINTVYEAVKDGGFVMFKIHEGNKSGIGKVTRKDCWQNNKKTSEYIPMIKEVFGDNNVIKKHTLIIAMK